MSNESPPTSKNRVETITLIAQDPVTVLQKNFDKGCSQAIRFLVQTRSEIRNDATYRIENPDSDFKLFYVSDSGNQGYYDALVRLLKRAGHDKSAVASALIDSIPSGATNMTQSEAVRQYVDRTESAIKDVYGR